MSDWEFVPPSWRPQTAVRRSASAGPSLRRRPTTAADPQQPADASEATSVTTSSGGGGPSGYLPSAGEQAGGDGVGETEASPSRIPHPTSASNDTTSVADSATITTALSSSPAAASKNHHIDNNCGQCRALQRRVEVLEAEGAEKAWASRRAVELTETVGRLEQESAGQRDTIARLTGNLRERTAAVEDLQRRLGDALEQVQRIALIRDACLRCVETDESSHRRELEARWGAAVYSFECEWQSYVQTWRYASAQCEANEHERMWLEDQKAHAETLTRMQAEVAVVDEVRRELQCAKEEIAKQKAKYRDLKEKGRAHVDELRATQEENLRRAKATYLRTSPNQATLLWALGHLQTIACQRFTMVLELANLQKGLHVLQTESGFLRVSTFHRIQQMATEVQAALRLCAPVSWTATPVQHSKDADAEAATVARGRQSSPPAHRQTAADEVPERYRPSSRPRSSSGDRSAAAARNKSPGASSRMMSQVGSTASTPRAGASRPVLLGSNFLPRATRHGGDASRSARLAALIPRSTATGTISTSRKDDDRDRLDADEVLSTPEVSPHAARGEQRPMLIGRKTGRGPPRAAPPVPVVTSGSVRSVSGGSHTAASTPQPGQYTQHGAVLVIEMDDGPQSSRASSVSAISGIQAASHPGQFAPTVHSRQDHLDPSTAYYGARGSLMTKDPPRPRVGTAW
jgi:hypothetical protein